MVTIDGTTLLTGVLVALLAGGLMRVFQISGKIIQIEQQNKDHAELDTQRFAEVQRQISSIERRLGILHVGD